MITSTPIDSTQVILAMITAIPGFIAAVAAAIISLKNRITAKDTNSTVREAKSMINGRMDELLQRTREAAHYEGKEAGKAEVREEIK